MLTDAHCHPFDLSPLFPQMEQERRKLGVIAAASSYNMEEFAHNEILAHNATAENAAPLLLCFGVHPQLPAVKEKEGGPFTETELNDSITLLRNLAEVDKIAAIGECGFDLYNAEFKETEKIQDAIFTAHLEIAINYDLPVVLHVRRAMHKIFAAEKELSKCRSVIFHSWSGTLEEARSLLRHGINAYFSFGNTITLNHKQAIQCCSLLPVERLLTETDAPFQPRRGENFSSWADLPLILKTAAALRNDAGEKIDESELEKRIEGNFNTAFDVK
ncbi:TatD family hydrolase [Treponema sp. R6D11]